MIAPTEISLPDGSVYKPETLPAGCWYGVVLHDDEKNEKKRDGLPETVPLFDFHGVELNQAWQEFLFKLLRMQVPEWPLDAVIRAWADLTEDGKCYTDHAAVQNGRADYIQHLNEGNQGIGWATLTTGGDVVMVTGPAVYKGGEFCYPVATLDGTKLPPDTRECNRLMTPHLIHAATTRSAAEASDGTHYVNPFPQLTDRTTGIVREVPVLFISNRPNWIRARHIRRLTGTLRPSPYVPGRIVF